MKIMKVSVIFVEGLKLLLSLCLHNFVKVSQKIYLWNNHRKSMSWTLFFLVCKLLEDCGCHFCDNYFKFDLEIGSESNQIVRRNKFLDYLNL